MNTNLVLLSGVIVFAGRWVQRKGIDVPAVVAVFFLALMIAGLSAVNDRIARGFAVLIFVAVLYTYGPDLFGAVNRATKARETGRFGGSASGGASGGKGKTPR